jgi:hypothetical protein
MPLCQNYTLMFRGCRLEMQPSHPPLGANCNELVCYNIIVDLAVHFVLRGGYIMEFTKWVLLPIYRLLQWTLFLPPAPCLFSVVFNVPLHTLFVHNLKSYLLLEQIIISHFRCNVNNTTLIPWSVWGSQPVGLLPSFFYIVFHPDFFEKHSINANTHIRMSTHPYEHMHI